MDVAYARGWSLGLDLRLLLRTPLADAADARRRDDERAIDDAGADRGRRPRLLGAEPRPQPASSSTEAELVAVCDLDPERLERDRAALSGRAPLRRRTTSSSTIRRSRRSRSPPRCTRIYALALGGARGRQARLRREAAGRVVGGGARADRAGRRARLVADAGPHVPLQPAGQRGPRPDPVRGARRHLLHLVEPGEPRPAPADVSVVVGSRPARLLDPSLLARRAPGARLGVDAGAASCPTFPTSRS